MVDVYVLGAYTAAGSRRDVGLNASGRVDVYTAGGVANEIVNVPDSLAPLGELPVYEADDTEHLIAYFLDQVFGLYEGIANSTRTLFNQLFESEYGDFEITAPLYDAEPSMTFGDSFVRIRLDFGETEQLHTGTVHRFRVRGELVATVHIRPNEGDAVMTKSAGAIAGLLRNQNADGVRFGVPSHQRLPISDGWARMEVHCPWFVDVDDDPLTMTPGSVVNVNEATNVVRSRFKTLVEDAHPITVHHDNAPYDIPDSALWVRWTVLPGGGQEVLSGRAHYTGVGVASVFSPVEGGDQTTFLVVDRIVEAFRAVSDQGVTFRTPYAQTIGRSGAWWQINVTCPYFYSVPA